MLLEKALQISLVAKDTHNIFSLLALQYRGKKVSCSLQSHEKVVFWANNLDQ